ncbi:MAG: Hpt domain-containing protein [Candidatus Acinetobacter avistercoris]|uniref:Hpt domain-containing protein n=1 Tax=Acinetobacter sp. KS-LM10 TaxID=3120518 RepID=UPI001FA1EE4F|nr:Hpt domain-containing protein [Candidatus Acinetobacter avistercoris]
MKEILKNLVETVSLPEDRYIDLENLTFFVEEIYDILEVLAPLISQWSDAKDQEQILITIRRNFHTLKGSGRMVGAFSSAELAWTAEDLLNRVIAKNLALSHQVQDYIQLVVNLYQHKIVKDLENAQPISFDLRPFILIGQRLQHSTHLEPVLKEMLALGLSVDGYNAALDFEHLDFERLDSENLDTPSLDTLCLDSELIDSELRGSASKDSASIVSKSFENAIKPVLKKQQGYEPTSIIFPKENKQEALNQKASNPALLDQDDKVTDEVFEIFVEEAEEHLQYIDQFVLEEQHTPDQYNRLSRALHTLRGSAAMADVKEISRASGQVEQLLKAVLNENADAGFNENALLIHYMEYVRDYLHLLDLGQHHSDQAHLMKQRFEEACNRYNFQVVELDHPQTIKNLMSTLVNLGIDQLLDAEFRFSELNTSEYPHYFKILATQAETLIHHSDHKAIEGIHEYSVALKSRYDAVLNHPELLNTIKIIKLFDQVHQEFIHLFDILATGQRVTLSQHAQALMTQLEKAIKAEIANPTSNVDVAQKQSTESSIKKEIVKPEVLIVKKLDLSRELETLVEKPNLNYFSKLLQADKHLIDSNQTIRKFDEDVLVFFIEEAEELLVEMDHELNQLMENVASPSAINTLMRHLHTLKGGANMVQAEHLGLISHELESIYELCAHKVLSLTTELVQTLRLVHDNLSERIQTIQTDQIDYPAHNAIALIQYLVQPEANLLPELISDVNTAPVDTTAVESTAQELDAQAVKSAAQSLKKGDNVFDILIATETDTTPSATNADSVEAIAQANFVEEAEDLISEAQALLSQWVEERLNRSLLLQLQRIAHSLKGGAKIAGLTSVAEISRSLENSFEAFAIRSFNSPEFDTVLNSAFEWLKAAILERNEDGFSLLKADLDKIHQSEITSTSNESLTHAHLFSATHITENIQGDGTEPPSMMGEWDKSNEVENSEEMIRISTDLIEKMIDLSGENAINRSRIEMDLNQLGHTLTDMELAIKRLADQLRRMDGELESQIHAKYDASKARNRDFDPLEMDQYSSLNELSKSLAESASDLVDFKSTIAEKIKDTEGVLLQQSRIQAELQEGLMRARLVPFSRLVPRLQRLVRQVSMTLNKPAELLVNNTEGELDRTILDKLISPLEHMLRNALDHGIEPANERIKRNKPLNGKIELDIRRQGSNILIAFTDDGKGIDANKIRTKAIDLGLMHEEQNLSDEEVLQFIFHPGFSTAEKITHISGRGVGLDVVLSGIKSLGGQVSVTSSLGRGSTFTIQVPTSVAVSDALMVKVADQQFAIPLSQIERIVRIESAALAQYFTSRKEYFEIDSQRCKLRHLAEFIGQKTPDLSGLGHSLPVLLIKGNMGKTTALVVDQLIGSRSQIVMKPIGEQFVKVDVVAGATIQADGQVCLILDGQQIARHIQVSRREMVKSKDREKINLDERRRLIMIVDDSVTVRKVTTRVLERHGYDVITAKDGVDAIEQLEGIKPDLMLLDIEMPRMDGFEVTSIVRHHQIHQKLPIIMITSRVGDKHRDRALSLGVNHYMGKPFQEAQLLENIEAALKVE